MISIFRTLALLSLLLLPASARGGVVAADHPLAAEAGAAVLRDGGNAFDAAVATSLALCVTRPYSTGIGGGGFIMLHLAGGDTRIIDCRETAPRRCTEDQYYRDGKRIPGRYMRGRWSVGTPGLLLGLQHMLKTWGTRGWAEVSAPAIRLATDGFPVDAHTHEMMAWLAKRVDPETESEIARIYLQDGKPYPVGAILRQPDLAATLRALATNGIASFYTGPLATRIVEDMQAQGGPMRGEDLSGYGLEIREPMWGQYRGLRLATMPPPSSAGPCLLSILGVLEGVEVPAAPTAAWHHTLAEAMKHAYADRAAWLGDPAGRPAIHADAQRMFAPATIRAIRAAIDPERTLPSPRDYGTRAAIASDGGTTHCCVVDDAGNVVSATETINYPFGSLVVPPGTGIVLNNELADFTFPNGPTNAYGMVWSERNRIAPLRRPLSSMSPTMVFRDEQPVMALGASGGQRIITAVLQTFLQVADFGQPIQAAVDAPRIHHQWIPDVLRHETALPEAEQRGLAARGHVLAPFRWHAGVCQAILRGKDGFTGAADPRKGGGVAYTTRDAEAQRATAELLDALASLKAFVLAEQEPAVEAVEPLKKTIDQHQAIFGQSAATIRAGFDLVQTYDTVKGPLFVARGEWDKGHRRKPTPPPVDIHWTMYHVMQHIFDHVYTAENIARHGDLLQGFAFGSSAHFPGPVTPPSDPEAVYTVKIDASAPEIVSYMKTGGPRRPTGAYVAPGHIVTVTVPPSMVGKDYRIRVGAHSWDNTVKRRVTRLARASLVFDIDATETRVASPLGGGIYFEVPVGADAGIVEVAFKNAVRAPFFSAKRFHKTTLKEWLEVERLHDAPWADFESELFLMNVPTMWIHKLDDPVTLMADWDRSLSALNKMFGQPDHGTRHTLYLQVDLQNRGRNFYPGYPTCNDRYDPKKADEYAGYADHYLVRGPQHAPFYVFHELGHAYNFVKYKGGQESAVNFLDVVVKTRAFGQAFDAVFPPRERTHDMVAITWMTCAEFAAGKGMPGYLRAYQPKGHAKYVDIARLFGWEPLDRFWSSYMQDVKDGTFKGRHSYANDEITLRKCSVSGIDLRPLLYFWGILEDDPETLAAAVTKAGAKPSAKIYDTLLHYQSLVPQDNAAFRAHAQAWWQKQPSPTGHSTERSHANQWENYDEKTAGKIRDVVQGILTRYFPDGRPD